MGINTEPHWTMYIEWEALENLALNGIFLSMYSPQSSGIYLEQEVERLQEPEVVSNSKEQYFPDTTGLIDIWFHRDCGSRHETCKCSK